MKFSQDGVPKENKRGNLCFCEIFEAGELRWNHRKKQKGEYHVQQYTDAWKQ